MWVWWAELVDAKEVRHQQVRSREAIRHEPFARRENSLELIEALPDPTAQGILLGT
jgi:hypothetical protein